MVVYQSRSRKRIHAIPRAPDGSAFRTCENCGLTVAIALADMHECGFEKNRNKRLKTQCKRREVERQKIVDQPRSAYRIFIEEFMKTCKDGNEIEIDKKGCQIWKNMTNQERHPFVLEADKLNWAYMKLLRDEENEIQRVDDEADSAEVGISNEDQTFSRSTGPRIFHSAVEVHKGNFTIHKKQLHQPATKVHKNCKKTASSLNIKIHQNQQPNIPENMDLVGFLSLATHV